MHELLLYSFKLVDGYLSVGTECHEENMETRLKAGHLSTTQLILRRGLTLLVAVGLLAVGVSVHFLVPLPVRPTDANFTLDWINTTNIPDQILSTVLV